METILRVLNGATMFTTTLSIFYNIKSLTADRPPGWNWGIVPVWVLERHFFPETAGNQGRVSGAARGV